MEKNYKFHERAFFCHKSPFRSFSDNSSSTEKQAGISFMKKKPPFQDGFEKEFKTLCIIEMNRHKKAPEGGGTDHAAHCHL
jgi:hypothetical protein